MVFSSTIFIFFFLPVVLAVYFLLPIGGNLWLLAASLFFYWAGGPAFFPIILGSIVFNYLCGCAIGRLRGSRSVCADKAVLILAVAGNLAVLGYWKYSGFILQTIQDITGLAFPIPDLVLPIGISFFTFQGMSYVIDVYRGDVPVQKNPLRVGLYIALFPQLIAGPIVRYTDIRPQLEHRTHNLEEFASGVRMFTIGLAKKAILANSTAVTADAVFNLPPYQNEPAVAWLGLISYTFQLYFDFSGYSDMAIGIGRMLGFRFPENFNYPYISRSVGEIWRRWHISLSAWFRDYVYIPLGGSRNGHVYRNLICIFVLTGIWHGASWNYVVWGLYWAILVVAERFLKGKTKYRLPALPAWVLTMLLWVFSLVIFRSPTLRQSGQYLQSMFGMAPPVSRGFTLSYYIGRYEIFLLFVCAVAATPLAKNACLALQKRLPDTAFTVLQNAGTLLLLSVSILYVVTGTYNPFIYFQF